MSSQVIMELKALATSRAWTTTTVQSYLKANGLNLPLSSLRGYWYGSRAPSDRIGKKLISILETLKALPESDLKDIKLRVTSKLLALPDSMAFAVQGINGSLKSPLKVFFFEHSKTDSCWLPLCDAVFWKKHVVEFGSAESIQLFESLFNLLSLSPDKWFQVRVQIQDLNTKESQS